jgi:ubiquinone/menaquinone biosynthesis C-methylase UbiE
MRRVQSFVLLLAFCVGVGLAHPASAQLAARSAEEWIKTLESPQRIAGLKIDETLAKLKLKPGNIVADIGAGSGVFEAPLAHAVSPGGKVYAVDIEQGLVDHITQRSSELHLANVQGVLGKFTDPNLPVRNVDLAFINDVLHHIQDRPAYLKSLAAYLKPSGRIAIIEFVPELGSHKAQPELQVTEAQATTWMAAAGLKPVENFDLFPDKWFVVYGK